VESFHSKNKVRGRYFNLRLDVKKLKNLAAEGGLCPCQTSILEQFAEKGAGLTKLATETCGPQPCGSYLQLEVAADGGVTEVSTFFRGVNAVGQTAMSPQQKSCWKEVFSTLHFKVREECKNSLVQTAIHVDCVGF
jgi:hypothetical protein